MAFASLKRKDEQTPQDRARAVMEAFLNKPDEPISAKQIRARKGQHLDVDVVLARSFKDVKSTSLAPNQLSFEQGKAT